MIHGLYLAGFLLAFIAAVCDTTIDNCYSHCHEGKSGMLNVHLIPSSHLDTGWLKTPEQYYYGTHSWIQKVGVQYILQSVVNELRNNPARRFTMAEVGYLWKWWNDIPVKTQRELKELVKTGRLEIVNGGWTMNDEATTSYQAIIDQYTLGFRKLDEMFDSSIAPRYGWQVDSYGNSKGAASLYSQFGFEGLFISRVDYQDKSNRLITKTMETIWAPSEILGTDVNIFVSILFNMYRSPDSYCFDILGKNDALNDDPHSRDFNVDVKVQQFIDFCEDQFKYYTTDNIAVVLGGDFNYQSAPTNYVNIDKLIRHVNAKQQTGSRVKLLYSTPSCYMKAVNEANLTWTTKEDDFFPYSNDIHSYWTGYYTSRPCTKYMERLGNNYLQIAKQLHVLAELDTRDEYGINVMEQAVATLQHHDAITGTGRQTVDDDYRTTLYNGFMQSEKVIKKALYKLMTSHIDTSKEESDSSMTRFTIDSCLLKNISQCPVSETSNVFVVTVYNPTSHPVTHYVRLPVFGKSYIVSDHNGDEVATQMVPVHEFVKNLAKDKSRNQIAELVFAAADLPPLGFRSYFIIKEKDDGTSSNIIAKDHLDPKHIANEKMELEFSQSDGKLIGISTPFVNKPFSLMQNFEFYKSFGSGSYLMKPGNESFNIIQDCAISLTTYKGDILEEVHQIFSTWVSQVVRLYKRENYVEFEWMIGPIPLEESGKDVYTRYYSELDNEREFYTDENGREIAKHVLNYRQSWNIDVNEPIASNYYPVSSRILIRDQKRKLEMAILTDRPQGGSSLVKGAIELGLHRRFTSDDNLGLGEALNEEEFGDGLVARGKHYLMIGKTDFSGESNIGGEQRELASKIRNGPWVFLTPADGWTFEQWVKTYIVEFHGLKDTLPANVHILTLQPWKNKSILIRLEHIMEPGDEEALCNPVTVDLGDLFTPFPVASIQEMTLGANRRLCDVKKLQWTYRRKCETSQHTRKCLRKGAKDNEEDKKIDLNPMQIRTFIIEVEW